jgi:hypothetical protein
MPFIQVNEYYINLDFIECIRVLPTEYVVYFSSRDGKINTTSVSKSGPAGEKFIQALMQATTILGG